MWSVVDLLRRNPHWWSPIISSAYGVNLDRRTFDRILCIRVWNAVNSVLYSLELGEKYCEVACIRPYYISVAAVVEGILMRSEVDYFIRRVLTVSLCVLYYGCFNFMCSVICVCFCNIYVLTFSVFCLCTYLYTFVLLLLFCVILMFCSCFVVLCIFIFVCTSVGLLPPGESPIAISNNNNNINNNNNNNNSHIYHVYCSTGIVYSSTVSYLIQIHPNPNFLLYFAQEIRGNCDLFVRFLNESNIDF